MKNSGMLIINADDWGRDAEVSSRILDCIKQRAVTSVSAMVFMENSEKAAAVALEHRIATGLHLNFTTPFSSHACPSGLLDRQQELARYLRRRLAQIVFHPGLVRSFEYVVTAQLDEFRRLYGADPGHLDGHHHMHLCVNVLMQRLLPPGTVVRRNFSFQSGEKNLLNRSYRRLVDAALARRHRLVDFFFSLAPVEPHERLQRIFSLARHSVVEVETHPVNPDEFKFLAGGEIFRHIEDIFMGAPSAIASRG